MSLNPTSPRHLVLRHGKRASGTPAAGDIKPRPEIGKGNQILHSYYRPGLPAGSYKIDVAQEITENENGTGAKLSKASSKSFKVVAPRYNLPAGTLNSVYPPHGHSASHLTLPHIVLNDPQFPWERVGSEKEEKGETDDRGKNVTPWLALLVFTHDEITLPLAIKSSLEALLELPPAEPGKPTKSFEPSPTLAYNLNIAKFVEKVGANNGLLGTPLTYDPVLDGARDDTNGDVVFIKKDLLTALCRRHGQDGAPDDAQDRPDVSRYRWLSHVRKVDTTGMANAGSTTGLLGERDSLFSVIVSHRTGPLDTASPAPVVAHLVSIEGLETNMSYPFQTEYIGLSSLHSWTYTSLPPNSLTVQDAFKAIGNSRELLRAPVSDAELAALRANKQAGENVANRLLDGYTLVKYRTQTGECTTAFYRGPFTPTDVAYPLNQTWGDPSTHGTDKQIFDRQLGMMDISYSAAWQLGRTLALADRSFTVALARVRRQIQDIGLEARKKEKMEKETLFQTKTQTIRSLSNTIKLLSHLPQGSALLDSEVTNRWQSHAPDRVDASFQTLNNDEDANEKQKLREQLEKAAFEVSGVLDHPELPYDEFGTPRSTDWAAVLGWVLDRMYLADIPPHYLMNELSLPPESIRFFAIDRNWTDALIDGALSLANHLERSDDSVRRAMQRAIKRYLATDSPGLGRKPPVPLYGFLLRSELVTAFPDMVVTTGPDGEADKPILIRHELLDSNVMLCLFDRPPKAGEFESITLGQPPHQPCFSIASGLSNQQIDLVIKPTYTGKVDSQPTGASRMRELKEGGRVSWTRDEAPSADKPPIFVWGSSDNSADLRYMLTHNYSTLVHDTVRKGMGEDSYVEKQPTSSLTAFQLNEPTWQLVIDLQADTEKTLPLFAQTKAPLAQVAVSRRIVATSNKLETTRVAAKRTLRSMGRLQRPRPLVLDARPPDAPLLPEISLDPTLSVEAAPILSMRTMASFSRFSASNSNSNSSPGAGDPNYVFKLSSIESDSSTDPLVPSKIAQDLIFSIFLSDASSAEGFELNYISVTVPFDIDPQTPEVLTQDYQGPGGFMITNLRFNMLTSLSRDTAHVGDKRYLKIELLPRSHRKKVPVSHCRDLTFLLSGVVVARSNVTQELTLKAVVAFSGRPMIRKDIVVERSY
ncbi:hypothetical protein F5Y17DRAFT_385043 [Xylariaceae sp. FL0594]|nr:hypothetical protein F5Y17DRAFT_385043 [Xylariaceae sp. FL0594]